jgi:GGDEF domain-containing protein
MKRKAITISATIGFVLYAAFVALAAYRIWSAYDIEQRAERAGFESLVAKIGEVGRQDFPLRSKVTALVEDYLRSDSRIVFAAFYDRYLGFEFVAPADSSLLAKLPNDGSPFSGEVKLNLDFTQHFRMDANLDSKGFPNTGLVLIANVPSFDVVFPALRDSFLGILAVILLLGIELIVHVASGDDPSERAKPRAKPEAVSPGLDDFELPPLRPQEGFPSTAASEASPDSEAALAEEREALARREERERAIRESFVEPTASGPSDADYEGIGFPEEDEAQDDFDISLEPRRPEPSLVDRDEDDAIRAAASRAHDPSDILHFEQPRGLYSPHTGLGWEQYFLERLEAEIERSASFEQDLALALLDMEGLARGGEEDKIVANALIEFFSFRDLSFELGDSGFAVILPNTDVERALRMMEECLKKLTFSIQSKRSSSGLSAGFVPLFIGLSSRSGRLIDAERLIDEAGLALEKAKSERDSRIIAFKPNADRYREYLAKESN